MEFVARFDDGDDVERDYGEISSRFKSQCNYVMERELSGYRFVGEFVTKITSPQEGAEIEAAMELPLTTVNKHVRAALSLMSDRNAPDYRNSIKESISAVEAMCRLIARDNATLGQALKKVKEKVPIHPALEKAFGALYGYTSGADGIRHSLIDEKSDLNFADARFMVVSCSAFVNYLVGKSSEAGIDLDASRAAKSSRPQP